MPSKKTATPTPARAAKRAPSNAEAVAPAHPEPTPAAAAKRSRKPASAEVPLTASPEGLEIADVQEKAPKKPVKPSSKKAPRVMPAAEPAVPDASAAPGAPAAPPAWLLDDDQRALLQSILAQAQQTPPADWLRFHLGRWAIGHIAPIHVDAVRDALPLCHVRGQSLVWAAQDLTPAERSELIGAAALRLRDAGLIPGWRHEDYRCEMPHPGPQDLLGGELFRLERAAFRFFGLRSRAVHINGFTERGLWCGRRSLSKPTDPGLLDNLAAGGLGAGEDLQLCAVRELGEEAGMAPEDTLALQPAGCLHSARRVGALEGEGAPLGWHDEILHVFHLTLPEGFEPHNRDGEVAEFLHLDLPELLERLARQEFTPDAAAVTAWGLLGQN